MILKEKNSSILTDKLEKAGDEAERKVAYYLKMAFGDEPRLLILNDLRVEFEDGITAQIDHLLIHQFGLIIIESKSVAGKLQVYDDGQWVRWYFDAKLGKDRNFGIQNPIKQAELQGKTLRQVLFKASTEGTRKVLEQFPVDVLVSISDSGVFWAHDRSAYPEVCKADQLEDRVKEIVLKRAKNTRKKDFRLSDANKARLANHLIKIHKPYSANSEAKNPVDLDVTSEKITKAERKISEYIATDKPKPANFIGVFAQAFSKPAIRFKHACLKCHSANLEIRYGNGYYFRCLDCDTNHRIDVSCPRCKRLLKIRKDRDHFFAECVSCGSSDLFHVNE